MFNCYLQRPPLLILGWNMFPSLLFSAHSSLLSPGWSCRTCHSSLPQGLSSKFSVICISSRLQHFIQVSGFILLHLKYFISMDNLRPQNMICRKSREENVHREEGEKRTFIEYLLSKPVLISPAVLGLKQLRQIPVVTNRWSYRCRLCSTATCSALPC